MQDHRMRTLGRRRLYGAVAQAVAESAAADLGRRRARLRAHLVGGTAALFLAHLLLASLGGLA